jgi:hypothetical protein
MTTYCYTADEYNQNFNRRLELAGQVGELTGLIRFAIGDLEAGQPSGLILSYLKRNLSEIIGENA